jgi:transcriptional regulator with XRE-family HTH domain
MARSLRIVPNKEIAQPSGETLGLRLAAIRRRSGLTLKAVSARTGIPVSTLSKVQNHQSTLNYENLVRLSVGLGVDVGEFFRADTSDIRIARRAIDRRGQGRLGRTERYGYEIFATELSNKRLVQGLLTITATTLAEVGGLSRHDGEEFIYVLSGVLDLRTEFYEPALLRAGDAAYLDSTMGHAYLAARVPRSSHPPEARILAVCSHAKFDGELDRRA